MRERVCVCVRRDWRRKGAKRGQKGQCPNYKIKTPLRRVAKKKKEKGQPPLTRDGAIRFIIPVARGILAEVARLQPGAAVTVVPGPR